MQNIAQPQRRKKTVTRLRFWKGLIMAEIFRPTYYVDPATNKRVNSGTPGAVRKKSPTWWIRYYTPDGKRHKVKGYTDKKATEAKAAESEPTRNSTCRGYCRTHRHSRQEAVGGTSGRICGLPSRKRPYGGTRRINASPRSRCLDACRFVRMSICNRLRLLDSWPTCQAKNSRRRSGASG